jgi:hypothetical protein
MKYSPLLLSTLFCINVHANLIGTAQIVNDTDHTLRAAMNIPRRSKVDIKITKIANIPPKKSSTLQTQCIDTESDKNIFVTLNQPQAYIHEIVHSPIHSPSLYDSIVVCFTSTRSATHAPLFRLPEKQSIEDTQRDMHIRHLLQGENFRMKNDVTSAFFDNFFALFSVGKFSKHHLMKNNCVGLLRSYDNRQIQFIFKKNTPIEQFQKLLTHANNIKLNADFFHPHVTVMK